MELGALAKNEKSDQRRGHGQAPMGIIPSTDAQSIFKRLFLRSTRGDRDSDLAALQRFSISRAPRELAPAIPPTSAMPVAAYDLMTT